MSQWLEPAGRVLGTVNMDTQREAHNAACQSQRRVSGIHRVVATETLSASNPAREGCVMSPPPPVYLPKQAALLWL